MAETQRLFVVVLAVLILATGVVSAVRPDIAYRWSKFGTGWQYRDGTPEPSDFRLALGRAGGVVSVLIGIGLLLFALLR